jgi:lysophospholipase L1-like esterase
MYQMKAPRPFTYLALGDSYTIGEGVKQEHSYPYQLVASLKRLSMGFQPPTIIAQTGWTTRELQREIEGAGMGNNRYDLVTLLIGVNNQYRGENLMKYEIEFSQLLDMAIAFAGNNPKHVIVISIPDWGVTPFAIAGNRDTKEIAVAIDRYNQTNKVIAEQKKVNYLNITREYRKIGGMPSSLVSDQLHPSNKVYQSWAEALKQLIVKGVDFEESSIRV